MSDPNPHESPLPYRSGEDDLKAKGPKVTGLVGGFIIGFILTETANALVGGGIISAFGSVDHDRMGMWVASLVFVVAAGWVGRMYVARRKLPFYKWSSAGLLIGICVGCLLSGLCFGGLAAVNS